MSKELKENMVLMSKQIKDYKEMEILRKKQTNDKT